MVYKEYIQCNGIKKRCLVFAGVCQSWSVEENLFGRANNLQQGQEDLHDVGIDGKSAEHILLGADSVLSVSDQKLRVVCQELQQEQENSSVKMHVMNDMMKSYPSNEIKIIRTIVKTMADKAAYSMWSQ